MASRLIEASQSFIYSGYLLAFIFATTLCLWAAWRARSVSYADIRRALTVFFLGSAVWAGGYVGFLVVEAALAKQIFYQSTLIVGFGTVWTWLWFCSAYSGRTLHRNRSVQRFAVAVFVVVTALKLTNPLHGLYYSLEPGGGPVGLVVKHKALYWVVMALSYALASAGYLMLFELFLNTNRSTFPLAVLTGLTGLPATLNVIGHVNSSLLDVTHEPLGVAVFAVGLLFVYERQFSLVRVTGSLEDPNLTVGSEGRIRGLGSGVVRTLPPLSTDVIDEPLAEVLPGLAETIRAEEPVWKAQCGEDTRFYRVVKTSPEGTGDTQMIVLSEITERKRRERELRQSERRFEAMLNDPNILAGVLAPDGTFLEVNDTAMEYIGVSREEVLGKPFWETPWWEAEDKPSVRTKVREAARGTYTHFETKHVTPSGEARTVTGVIRPVTDKEGEVVSLFVTSRDVTERKRKAKRLRKAKERAELAKLEAEEASRMKSAMLANMSHEIRTPLTSIIGFAEAIVEAIEGEGKVARFADLIENSGQRLLDTLDAILNLSKLEAGQMQLESRPVDLAGQAERIVEEFMPQAEDQGLGLEVRTEKAEARADEGGVKIVLQNLVSNAIKYTEEGAVTVRTYQEHGDAVLEVEDTGIGMDPAVAETLFEPFRQASEGRARKYEGTGVGLAVTKKATEQMGGSIEVETQKGDGSRFVARLPAVDNKAQQNGALHSSGHQR